MPKTLTNLTFGSEFNQPIDNLPCGLKYLALGRNFKQPINFLPDSLESLYLRSEVDINCKLPSTLTKLTIPEYHEKSDIFPISLKYIYINSAISGVYHVKVHTKYMTQ